MLRTLFRHLAKPVGQDLVAKAMDGGLNICEPGIPTKDGRQYLDFLVSLIYRFIPL